jgi:hypothetical protein
MLGSRRDTLPGTAHRRGGPLVILLAVCAATAGLVYFRGGLPARSRSASAQEVILDAVRDRPEDVVLGRLFDELNARHFGGRLPDAKVMWASELDRLDVGDYRLNGMTDGKTILLKTALRDHDADVRRTLCHEMVHVAFIAAGRKQTTHEPSFQEELRRIFEDGCFPAILASPDEKASLKTWLDSERSRLDAVRVQIDGEGAAIKQETARVGALLAALNERIESANASGSGWPAEADTAAAERQRAALNDRIVILNSTIAANQGAQGEFNAAVERYNLMLSYPDGLAEDRAKGLIR